MIGVLAYGSLITDPGPELQAVILSRRDGVSTPFAVEYARSSAGRKGAPTLVPVTERGASVLATIFEVAVSADEAADIVYRREAGKIGTGRKYVEPANPTANTVIIERFADFEGFEVVLSTRIGANIQPLSADTLATLALKSAREAAPGNDGITYLMNAMRSGIVTPLTSAYEAAILTQTGACDLAAALAAVRPA
jgi:cation transport regulator ChaC